MSNMNDKGQQGQKGQQQAQRPDPAHDDAHDLLPAWLAATIPPLYATSEKKAEDVTVRAKFFHPVGAWTWYVTEYSPEEHLCFGYVVGLDEELGYFSLDELLAVRGAWGLRIERDLYWRDASLADVRAGKAR